MTRDKKDCRDKEIVPTYPDFSLVLDARDPQKEGILIGIQHQRKCFANLETVRKGLENYWNELVGKMVVMELTCDRLHLPTSFGTL